MISSAWKFKEGIYKQQIIDTKEIINRGFKDVYIWDNFLRQWTHSGYSMDYTRRKYPGRATEVVFKLRSRI